MSSRQSTEPPLIGLLEPCRALYGHMKPSEALPLPLWLKIRRKSSLVLDIRRTEKKEKPGSQGRSQAKKKPRKKKGKTSHGKKKRGKPGEEPRRSQGRARGGPHRLNDLHSKRLPLAHYALSYTCPGPFQTAAHSSNMVCSHLKRTENGIVFA
jgi:hypothetical protein